MQAFAVMEVLFCHKIKPAFNFVIKILKQNLFLHLLWHILRSQTMFVNKVEKALVGSAARRNLHNLLCLPSKASASLPDLAWHI